MNYTSMFNQDKERKKWESRAKDYINNKEKTQSLLNDAAKKAKEKESGPLSEIHENLKMLFMMVKDYIDGRYRKVPIGTIAMVTTGLVYFVSPVDLVPDFIVGLGLIDDVAILGFTIKQIIGDLNDYKAWKSAEVVTDN